MATLTEKQVKEREQQGLVVYSKTCKYCGKEYKSDARNQGYCCSDCVDKAQVVKKKKVRKRKEKRKEYSENKEINRALTKAYSLCETVFELYEIPKKCNCAEHGFKGPCKGSLERNHKDLNPFNNAPWNLEYLCKSHHKEYHDKMGDVNMVKTYNEAMDEAGFEDEDKRHKVMIQYTRSKIQNAGGINDGESV